MSPLTDSPVQSTASQSGFVSDVLHKLSQPLTALHCSLELSLASDQTAAEFRASVEAALLNAERLRQGLLLLRELSDADDPGDISIPVPLRALLGELQQDFLPVCESAGGCFTVSCEPVEVKGNGAKLRRAFFYLLEYLLGSSRHRNLDLAVHGAYGRRVEIRMVLSGAESAAASTPDLSASVPVGEMEIARRTFRAAGGDLEMIESAGCVVTLAVAD